MMITTTLMLVALAGQTAAQRIEMMGNPPPQAQGVGYDAPWLTPEVAVTLRDVLDGNTVLIQFPCGKLIMASLIGLNKESWELEDAEYLESYIGARVLVA